MTPASLASLAGRRLVVFGAGYVGGRFAEQAVRLGLTVTALTRNQDVARALQTQGVKVVVAQLHTSDWHKEISAGPDFVLNCVSSGGGGLAGYEQSYWQGMESICAWARRARLGTFIYTSSTSVYPQGEGVVVTEDDPAEPEGEGPAVLRRTERLIETEMASLADRYFIFRLAGIYGPGRHQLLDRLREGADTLPGKGDHRLNLIHRDDIAAAVWSALISPAAVRNETFNLADDHPATKSEVAAWLSECLGRSSATFDGNATPGRRALVPDRIIANGKAKALLGWQPRFPSFREGYKAILEA